MPLFPLDTVLFPYAQILVHVVNGAFFDMVTECADQDRPFGVVLIRSVAEEAGDHPQPYMVGTAVRILGIDRFEDGSMNVRVQGERRFRIRRLDETGPFLVGHVEPVVEVEVPDCPRADALALRAREDFGNWVQMQIARKGLTVQIRFPEDYTALSFAIANFLPISNLEKQQLLEQVDTVERVATLIPLLEQQMVESDTLPYERLTVADLAMWASKN